MNQVLQWRFSWGEATVHIYTFQNNKGNDNHSYSEYSIISLRMQIRSCEQKKASFFLKTREGGKRGPRPRGNGK